jgi:tetratricopeptide (TPR) repeat protein
MRRICRVGLLAILILAGCSRKKVARDVPAAPTDEPVKVSPNVVDNTKPKQVIGGPVEVVPAPRVPDVQGYEAALLDAVDFLTQRKYLEALAALEKAQKCQDTGAVQREIDQVRAVLAEQDAASKAVRDFKIVLEDGKAEDAVRLVNEALAQHGGGDSAAELVRLKQQADAVATVGDEAAARLAKLKAEVDTGLADNNLRAAVVALEQALALRDDAGLAAKLQDVRDKLQTYDDNRAAAKELRTDPTRLEEGLACLNKAAAGWNTLQVRQEIDEFRLIMEKRRDRLAVADFEVCGDVGVPAAGQVVAEALMDRFKPRFDVVERSRLRRVLEELNIGTDELAQVGMGSEVSRLAKVRYVVVGSVTPLAGVTVQARLVEASTGLVVQTARVSAPNTDALIPLLAQLAAVLQMTDEQRLAFEGKLAAESAEVKPVDAGPMDILPPPPPAGEAVVAAPIITWSPRPAILGGLAIEDFAALPPRVATPSMPQAVDLVIRRNDPRRNRLLRLALEIGDNLFRRGRPTEAQRHYSLAFTLAVPRREIALRLNACRDAAPPAVAVSAAPVRPRMAVLGFYLDAPASPTGWMPGMRRPPEPMHGMRRPALPDASAGSMSPNIGDLAADQFASYCGDYELIDCGEVNWYMGRLGIKLRDLVRDPAARRCLAQALNTRFFVFGSIQQTASFDVNTYLIDAEAGSRTGMGMIHVQDRRELRLRMHELIRQMGAKPGEQKKLQEQGNAAGRTLIEARRLLKANEPGRAAELLRSVPVSIGQQSLLAEAMTKQRLAAFDEARRKESAERAASMRAAQKRREELAANLAQASRRATEGAKTRSEAERKQLQAQREKAAVRLHEQAADVARARAENERRKRDVARQAQIDSARKRVEKHKDDCAASDAERGRTLAAHDQALHDGFVKQAKELIKKDPEAALAAAHSARRVKPTLQSATLVRQAQDALALADAQKRGAEAMRKLEEERKKREEAALQAKSNRDAYLDSLKKGDDAATAKKYTDALGHYQAALKLFRTDLVLSKLKSVSDIVVREKAASAAKEAEAKRATQVKDLLGQGQKALAAKKYTQAVELFKQVRKLAPDNVEALAGLTRAERERDMEMARLREREDAKNRDAADPKMKRREANYQLAMDAAKDAIKKSNWTGAVNCFNEALRHKLGDKTALEGLASAQKLAAAEEAKKREAANKGKPPPPVNAKTEFKKAMQQGASLEKQGKYASAVTAYQQALKWLAKAPAGNADAFKAYMGIGRSEHAAKHFAEAVKAYEEALKRMPDQADAKARLARAKAGKP